MEQYNPFLPEKTKHDEDENLQWLLKRRGNFNGSKITDLMSCSRLVSKKGWGDPAKLFGVGTAFYKYVFQIAMERKTGLLDRQVSSFNFDYGHENEPDIVAALIKDKVIESHSDCEYTLYKELNLGATPDGRVTVKGEVMALEMKSSVSWDGCYSRKKSRVDEKHGDFWQIQGETLVMGVKKCLYVVTYPMSSDQYATEFVEASELHQKRIIQRVALAEKCISNWDFKEDIETSFNRTIKEEYANLPV